LNHPNIATIYGLEQADGKRFLTMELVEGETLEQRIAKGPLPVDESLEVCRQIAEGLEAAHEKGIIHRDLKPANVKITLEDKVKILDFGLAKEFQDKPSAADASHSPTLTDQMTRPGVILGTAAYMSPEQAKGRAVDKRADIWAFGCILFECLTGRRVFEGETVTETLAAILKGEPDWIALPTSTPSIVRLLMRQCLQRDPARRLRDIADARFQIQEGLAVDGAVTTFDQSARKSGLREKAPWALAAVGFALAASVLILWSPWKPPTQVHPDQTSLRLNIELPAEAPMVPMLASGNQALAFSPDGRFLAYVAWIGEHTQLYIRNMTNAETKPVTGSEGARCPFFSPDGQWLGFTAGNKLNKVSMGGGVPVPLADIGSFDNGAVWGKNGISLQPGRRFANCPDPSAESARFLATLPAFPLLALDRMSYKFFRDRQGLEVDFLVPKKGGGLALIEAKATRTVRSDSADSLRRLQNAASAYSVKAFLVHLPAADGPSFASVHPGARAITCHGIPRMVLGKPGA
jgi:hypothetical protein